MKLDIYKKEGNYIIYNNKFGLLAKVSETVEVWKVIIKYPIGVELEMELLKSKFKTIYDVRDFVLNETDTICNL